MRTFWRTFAFGLVLMGIAACGWAQNTQKALDISDIKVIRKGTTHHFNRLAEDDFDLNLICSEDTGAVDICFVLDTTGSMSSSIRNATSHMIEFATLLGASGYDAYFGLITYGDGYHFPLGRDFVSVDSCVTYLGPLGSGGGGDTEETALDGIMAAVTDMTWHPGAVRVIILLTDAAYCQRGGSCYDCISDYLDTEVATALMDGGFMFFACTLDPVYGGGCSSAASCLEWYRNTASATGGSWFNMRDSFASIYSDLIGLLGTFQVIEIDVTNTTASPITDVYAALAPGSCIELIYGTLIQSRPVIPAGSTVSLFWRVNYTSGCLGADGCFEIQVSAADPAITPETASGCMYIPNCGCTPVVSVNRYPSVIGTYTACQPSRFEILIHDDDLGVDASTISLNVNGTAIGTSDPRVSFTDSILVYTPGTSEFASGSRVDYTLLEAEDMGGCSLVVAASGWFMVDYLPPVFSNILPLNAEIVGGVPTDIAVNISDAHSGLNESSVIFTVNGTEYHMPDSHLRFEDGRLHFNPIGTYTWAAGDSVHICVSAADNVPTGYCGPNSSDTCWFFTIDNLYMFFEDTLIYPGDDLVYPLLADNPGRFGIHNFDIWIAYNPSVLDFNGVTLTGTAAAGFTVTADVATYGIIHVTGHGMSALAPRDTMFFLNFHANDGASGGAFSNMRVHDAILDSGRVGWYADAGMILLDWVQIAWLHDLVFYGYNETGGYLLPQNLSIGAGFSATEGYDAEYDLILPPPPPSRTEVYLQNIDPLYPTINRLQRSIKDADDLPIEWLVITIEEPGSLYWNPDRFPTGVVMLNHLIDMKVDSVYHYAANETLVITYSQPAIGTGEISGCRGWNLMGLSTAVTDEGWLTAFGATVLAGPIEWDALNHRAIANAIPRQGFGFWVFSLDEFSAEIGGIPIDEITIPIYRGWNLIGSVSSSATYTATGATVVSVYGWSCEFQNYIPVTTLEPGNGYWLFSTGTGTLHIHP